MRRFALILFCSFLAANANAQTFFSTTEYGMSVGGSQYFGDLNDKYGFHYIRPAGGAFVRFHLNPYIAVRGSLTYTRIGADDKNSNNDFNKARNLSFRSDIVEASIQSEFNFTRFNTGEVGSRFTPYITLGIGATYYNPYAELNNNRYYLRKLGTEGQNLGGYDQNKYSHFTMCFPLGAGIKHWLRPGVNLGFEIADRLTLSDYIDDVSTSYVGEDNFPNDPLTPNPAFYLQDRSAEVNGQKLGRVGKQRGNSQTKDQYLYFIFNLSFQLKVYKCPSYLQEHYME